MERLRTILASSVQKGEFTLASGRKSDYFLDVTRAVMKSQTLPMLKEVLWSHLMQYMPSPEVKRQFGGPACGAIPLVLLCLNIDERANGFWVKDGKMDGCFDKDVETILVDDVITSGGSVLKVADAVEKAGGKVKQVIGLVDRLEGGRENIEKRFAYKSIFTIRDLLPGR